MPKPEIPESWPADRLESVVECPLCGSPERDRVYADLTDTTFLAAPGRWTMWRCRACRSGWLDPRPDEASIGLAYTRYYTHLDPAPHPPSDAASLTNKLGNGYRNFRFGTDLRPSNPLGVIASLAAPRLRVAINSTFRYLPRRTRGEPARLLDVGCGSAEFLDFARDAGWTVFGSEPDPVARANARQRGLDVRASIADFDADPAFDAIMLSHVLEHVHNPHQLLRDCQTRLRRGGTIYVATPNFDSVGHDMFGRNWRGLEVPRHLILFNRKSLTDLLRKSGFRDVRYRSSHNAFGFMVDHSRRIAAGLDPHAPSTGDAGRQPTIFERFRAWVPGKKCEYLVVTAIRR